MPRLIHCQGYGPSISFQLRAMDAVAPSEDEIENHEDLMNSEKLDRLCELLEKLLAQRGGTEAEDDEEEYERTGRTERNEPDRFGRELIPTPSGGNAGNANPTNDRAALQNLRNLRGLIESRGDRKAIDSYNQAIRAVKARIADAEMYGTRHASRSYASDARRNEAESFEQSARKLHRKELGSAEVTADERHSAADSEQPETFDQAVSRHRKAQLAKKPAR